LSNIWSKIGVECPDLPFPVTACPAAMPRETRKLSGKKKKKVIETSILSKSFGMG